MTRPGEVKLEPLEACETPETLLAVRECFPVVPDADPVGALFVEGPAAPEGDSEELPTLNEADKSSPCPVRVPSVFAAVAVVPVAVEAASDVAENESRRDICPAFHDAARSTKHVTRLNHGTPRNTAAEGRQTIADVAERMGLKELIHVESGSHERRFVAVQSLQCSKCDEGLGSRETRPKTEVTRWPSDCFNKAVRSDEYLNRI